ncbi:hypothetical protein [Priestia filamentosa]|uniref:hypothetical protein n=1 Tax=Priestia filamentosa TaxID=1402861 RepID=UPI000E7170B8|nr:hypothetical protein [Priestia filamentosa]RJS63019.1 hypothetical protein CJ485_24080 [Priestia filamentosa]
MRKICIAVTVALVVTGCSDKTTTQETNHEENTTKQNQENKQGNTTPSNTEYINQYEGYWKSEDSSVFVEIRNIEDQPLYVIHNLDGTQREFSLQVDTKNKQQEELKGTITANEESTLPTSQTIDIKTLETNKLLIDTENPVTFIQSNKTEYDKFVQSNKEQLNSEGSIKNESLDKTLQLLNGTWKSTTDGKEITISVDSEDTGTFQWKGYDPVTFIINENENGEVDIVYESLASQSHRMIEWTWVPAEQQLTWKNMLDETITYNRIQ